MKNVVIEREKCIACGACSGVSEVFSSNPEGYAIFANGMDSCIITENNRQEIQSAIHICPANAICIKESDEVIGISDSRQLIGMVLCELAEYNGKEILPEDIEFPLIGNSTPESMASIIASEMSDNLYGNLYKSEMKAQRAGENEFSNNRNRLLEIKLREWLSEYKTGVLNKYRIFEENEENFYYSCLLQFENILKQIDMAFTNLYGSSLPKELLQVNTRVVWRRDTENKNNALDYLEMRLLPQAMEDVEAASWYYTWIDVDGDDDMWFVNVREANLTMAKHAASGFREAVKFSNVKPIIDQTTEEFLRDLKNEAVQKAERILEEAKKYDNEIGRHLESKEKICIEYKKRRQEKNVKAGNLASVRQLISLKELTEENLKKHTSESYFDLVLDLESLNGKKVHAGEVVAIINEGKHIHIRCANTGQSQPYGFGEYVPLRREYKIVSEIDGIVHIFTTHMSEFTSSPGVIAPVGDNLEEIKQWYEGRK